MDAYCYAVVSVSEPEHVAVDFSGMDRQHPYTVHLGVKPLSSAVYLSETPTIVLIRGLFEKLAAQNPSAAVDLADALVAVTLEVIP